MQSPFAFHVGVDWGTESHQVCVLDAGSQPVSAFRVAHSAAAVREFCARLAQLAPTGGSVVAHGRALRGVAARLLKMLCSNAEIPNPLRPPTPPNSLSRRCRLTWRTAQATC